MHASQYKSINLASDAGVRRPAPELDRRLVRSSQRPLIVVPPAGAVPAGPGRQARLDQMNQQELVPS